MFSVLILVMIESLILQKGFIKKNNIDFSFNERKILYENVPKATNFLFDIGGRIALKYLDKKINFQK